MQIATAAVTQGRRFPANDGRSAPGRTWYRQGELSDGEKFTQCTRLGMLGLHIIEPGAGEGMRLTIPMSIVGRSTSGSRAGDHEVLAVGFRGCPDTRSRGRRASDLSPRSAQAMSLCGWMGRLGTLKAVGGLKSRVRGG
ncbi:hypothetical protein ADK35_02175 [Streptomyces viridochromogenes]|nr:hypothetical protein ADK35_02175 [Streptomyces viridochromogenes]